MKNTLLFLSFLLILSCSVQKRKYQKGFYVNRLHHKSQTQKAQPQLSLKDADQKNEKKASTKTLSTGDHAEVAGSDNKVLLPVLKKHTLITPPDTCDMLIFKDGSEIAAKVYEISSTDVKYKRCDNPDGPSYVTRKSDLFMVKYANGTKEVMKEEKAAATEMPTYQPRTPQPRYEKSKPKADHPFAIASLVLGVLSAMASFVLLVASLEYTFSESTFFIAGGVLLVTALIALVLGRIALREIKEGDVYKGKGMAIPGTIISAIILGFWALIMFLALVFLLV